MTREEEIRNAIDTIFPIHPFDKGRKYEQALMATGFEAGVKWADANPKSTWVSVKEGLPPEGEYGISMRVLVLNIDKKIGFGRYDYDAERWLGPGLDMEFTHWMLIPEPPKTGD